MTTARSYSRALVNRLAGWALGLPSESCGYTITPARIPLDDGISLAADLYQPVLPAGKKLTGQLLVYSPYGRGAMITILNVDVFCARGFQVLLVSSRGTCGSEGKLDPMRAEAADMQGVIRWMRQQPWYPGTFATFGASWLGYAQWALLDNPPDDLIACAISVGPHDYSQYVWGTGSFRLDRLSWADGILTQEDKSLSAVQRLRKMLATKKRLQPVFEAVPFLEGFEKSFGENAPWLRDMIVHPDPSKDFYMQINHSVALEKVQVPVFLTTGWYDAFLEQSIMQYARLQERGIDVKLHVGPWTHITASGPGNLKDIYAWLSEQAGKRNGPPEKAAVRVHVGGIKEWRDLPKWPPTTTTETWYLQPRKCLSKAEPKTEIHSSTFTYDPRDPTPTIGGPLLSDGGRVRDEALAARHDVLSFTTDTLEKDVEVMGKPAVVLHHSSDNPNADIFVRLSEVDNKGHSYNITESFKRIQATPTSTLVRLDMLDCAHRFKKGTRIRLLVAGGSFPMYLRNFGTDEAPGTAVNMVTATHEITHASGGLSCLNLPVCMQ